MTRWISGTICALCLAVVTGCGAPPAPAPPPESQAPPAVPQQPAATPEPAAPAPTPAPATDKPATPAKPTASPAVDTTKPSAATHGTGVYAHITTNHGSMIARLFDKDVPKTVENFVGLAEGKKQWRNPRTKTMVRRPYYNNLTFHRIIPRFMIQGGDPEGTGMGGPGFTFADEFNAKLRHHKAGTLSMANAGPNTNGGQFFITLAPTPHLDNRHSVFGELVEGTDVLMAIGNVPTSRADNRPLKAVVIKSIRIERVP